MRVDELGFDGRQGLVQGLGALRQGRFVPFGPFLAGGGVVVVLAGLPTVLGWIGW